MEILTTSVGETKRLKLSGRVDALEADKLTSELNNNIEPERNILIDLADVEFVDSSGLAVLVKCWRRQSSGGGSLSVVLPTADVARRVFDLTGFDQVFHIVEPDSVIH